MIELDRLGPALAVAGSGWLLAAGTASAHAGEVHAPGAIERAGGPGLLAVVLMVGVGYWLTNRVPRPAADPAPQRATPPLTAAEAAEAAPQLVSPTAIRRQLQATWSLSGDRHGSTAEQRQRPQPNPALSRPVAAPSQAAGRGLDPPGANRLA